MLVLPRYIHLLLKSNTAIQVASNFSLFSPLPLKIVPLSYRA